MATEKFGDMFHETSVTVDKHLKIIVNNNDNYFDSVINTSLFFLLSYFGASITCSFQRLIFNVLC